MLNSRDISDLRPDVAQNCAILIRKMNERGYKVGVFTVRDDEFQADCFKRGTGGRSPATFHSVHAGLAFDVFKNVQGHAYDDPEFFRLAGEIGTTLGFTWGGSWKKKDNPHFQWDGHKRFTNADIKAHRYPPQMPKFKEVINMNPDEAKAIVKEKTGLSDATIQYMADDYRWGNELIVKLAEAMK